MIAKAHKFPTRTQFLNFRSQANQLNTPHLRFLFADRPVQGSSPTIGLRLSVIVPLKVNKRATTRNHFKRLVYDTLWKTLKAQPRDCIVIFKPIPLLKGPESDQLIHSELSTLKL